MLKYCLQLLIIIDQLSFHETCFLVYDIVVGFRIEPPVLYSFLFNLLLNNKSEIAETQIQILVNEAPVVIVSKTLVISKAIEMFDNFQSLSEFINFIAS